MRILTYAIIKVNIYISLVNIRLKNLTKAKIEMSYVGNGRAEKPFFRFSLCLKVKQRMSVEVLTATKACSIDGGR